VTSPALPSHTNRRALTVAACVLAAALMAGLFLRIAGAVAKRTFTHDEAIAFLAATGHQGDYARIAAGEYPYGTWAPASQWKRLLQIEEPFCFGRIGRDLARFDIHPPLYFWLLHLWALRFGIGPLTASTLNIMIAAVAIVALFGLACRVLQNRIHAGLVAFVWAVSPAVVPVCFEERHYELFGLWAILCVWQVLRVSEPGRSPTVRDMLILSLVTAAGILTHYHFALVAGGCAVWLILRRHTLARGALPLALGAISLGILMLLVVHPDFYLSFLRLRQESPSFTPAALLARVCNVSLALAGFLFDTEPVFTRLRYSRYAALTETTRYAAGIALLAGFALAVLLARRWQRRRARQETRPVEERAVTFFLVWLLGVTIVLYLAFCTPAHAMGGPYLSAVWPFLAFVPVLALRSLARGRAAAATAFCLALAASGGARVVHARQASELAPDPSGLWRSSKRIVLDNVARGILPRVFWHVPAETLIFAAEQEYLLGHREAWLGALGAGSLYISELSYGGTEDRRARILAAIVRRFGKVQRIEGGIFGLGQVFRIASAVPGRDARSAGSDPACVGGPRKGPAGP